jgi:hypothetical protein
MSATEILHKAAVLWLPKQPRPVAIETRSFVRKLLRQAPHRHPAHDEMLRERRRNRIAGRW